MAAAATIVASNTLRVHMLVSSCGLPKVEVTPSGCREVPVESVTQVGPDRPCTSDWPYLELPPELPAPELDEPDADEPPEADEPPDGPPGEAVGAAAPAVEPMPAEDGVAESHFSFLYCASVGASCAHSAALDFFALFAPEVEPLLLALPVLLLATRALSVDDWLVFFALAPDVLPLVPEAPLLVEPDVWPYALPCAWPVLPLAMEPPWPLEALVPDFEPSTGAAPDDDEALPLEPMVLEAFPLAWPLFWLVMEPPWPLGAAVSALPPSTDAPLEDEVLGAVDDVVLLVPLLCVLLTSALGDFLFLFMSPSASADPLVSATIDVRMNAGASLRIWASKVVCG
jgi:hypothetical protein